MLKEIKNIILEDKKKRNYYEENVLALAEYGYDAEYMDEETYYEGRWETETIYYYKVTKKSTGDIIYIGVIDSRGNTEMQESEGITEIHEVKPKEIKTTAWKII